MTQLVAARASSLSDAPSHPHHLLPQTFSTKEKESYRMSTIPNLHSFYPLDDASKDDDLLLAGTEGYIHIRIHRETEETSEGV